MDQTFGKLVEQIPWGAVCIAIVWMFLKAQKDNSNLNREMLKEFHADHLVARKAAEDAILRNADATVKIATALTTLGEAVRTNASMDLRAHPRT